MFHLSKSRLHICRACISTLTPRRCSVPMSEGWRSQSQRHQSVRAGFHRTPQVMVFAERHSLPYPAPMVYGTSRIRFGGLISPARAFHSQFRNTASAVSSPNATLRPSPVASPPPVWTLENGARGASGHGTAHSCPSIFPSSTNRLCISVFARSSCSTLVHPFGTLPP